LAFVLEDADRLLAGLELLAAAAAVPAPVAAVAAPASAEPCCRAGRCCLGAASGFLPNIFLMAPPQDFIPRSSHSL